MQYANIHSDDIIFVAKTSASEITDSLPRVTLLSFSPGNDRVASHKIRRTWRIENASIDQEIFRNSMRRVLSSPLFLQLRNDLKEKCPSDDVLMLGAIKSLRNFQHARTNTDLREQQILISTTFRTERDRLEFSIHPLESLQGTVTSVMHRRRV